MPKLLTGGEIRKQFIDYFLEHGHTYVHSASLVPGNDQTLLFTNAGMVQFKDIFLGTDTRSYKRAVNSQKCMRVSGKHNDLDDVGRDDTHHTFFEMLGNWSFGDYYKKEAISWAWDLLVNIWEINPQKLWVTCFKDEKAEIPADHEAAEIWANQPKIDKGHILFFGRKENFWEMAETGPCGPCSEIHIDRGSEFCDKSEIKGHICGVNRDCARFVELWNLVFIQYNRLNESKLVPLPEKHVDTGMGLDRIVSVIQNKRSNYFTDLLFPLIKITLSKSNKRSIEEVADITPYRVIADHTRAAVFLIADGVVPGNIGRNYICRMIIRRAARFGSKIGLHDPYLADIANEVINIYQTSYPELEKNKKAILDNIYREELKFKDTVTNGLNRLEDEFAKLKTQKSSTIKGDVAFELYATHGLPLEITRDEARERGFSVDEKGFYTSMETHRQLSGAGKAIGEMRADNAEFYSKVLQKLIRENKLSSDGVLYKPYDRKKIKTKIAAIVKNGELVQMGLSGEDIEIILPETNFYIQSGGQVSDTGKITSDTGDWEINIYEMSKPAAGVILHLGRIEKGEVHVNDAAVAEYDEIARIATMRNHTATHLLHAVLHRILGDHARQAGSLVSPEKLRFDFTHPDAINSETLQKIEWEVNEAIFENREVKFEEKPLDDAMKEGAMALFGEKYNSRVRTVSVQSHTTKSYELCGGTHVDNTGNIGLFIITSEGSVAAGIRRIEAITGERALEFVQQKLVDLEKISRILGSSRDEAVVSLEKVMAERESQKHDINLLEHAIVMAQFENEKNFIEHYSEIDIMILNIKNSRQEIMRSVADQFRKEFSHGILVISSNKEEKTQLIVAISADVVEKGFHAGALAKQLAGMINGSGGGKPELAQAGGSGILEKDAVLHEVRNFIEKRNPLSS